MTMEELEAKLETVTKHRDAWKKMLDETNGHVRNLAALVEPGLNRHPITVIQAAQGFIRTIVEQRDVATDSAFMFERDWKDACRERDEARAEVEMLRERVVEHQRKFEAGWAVLCKERDETRAEVERLKLSARLWAEDIDAVKNAYRRGAEAMREACATTIHDGGLVWTRESAERALREIGILEEP